MGPGAGACDGVDGGRPLHGAADGGAAMGAQRLPHTGMRLLQAPCTAMHGHVAGQHIRVTRVRVVQ